MKKRLISLILCVCMLISCLAVMSSCEIEDDRREKEGESTKGDLKSFPKESVSSNEEQAESESESEHKYDDVSDYIIEREGKQYLVLPLSGKELFIDSKHKYYLKFIDFQMLKSAEEKITNELSKYSGDTPAWYLEDSDGELFLAVEMIIDLEPPTCESGEYVGGGCGIDHDHIFFREPITSIDLNDATYHTHTECAYCGEVGEEYDRWFIAEVMDNGMVLPVGNSCFERVSAMDAGIWLQYSAVDGDKEKRLQKGDVILVTYSGMIMTTYPAQISATTVEIVK